MKLSKTELLNRCARDGEERTLLARVLDKLETAQNRSIPSYSHFLSPGEGAAVQGLLAAWGHPAHRFFGGFERFRTVWTKKYPAIRWGTDRYGEMIFSPYNKFSELSFAAYAPFYKFEIE